ncbi:unnamed protein product [Caenorhabditis auriculariae]|uniref:Uncharacterized protein n=1 Tax=Caenorhabditis auriculariae TaxID=2777116 RepID=A0A8S1HEJ9_9PELO|nr:unnamed protein product [Caenorhabditis auriculariae]
MSAEFFAFLLFLAFAGPSCAQVWMPLSGLKQGMLLQIDKVGAHVYISSTDDATALKGIKLKMGTTVKTAFDVSQNYTDAPNGLKKPWVANSVDFTADIGTVDVKKMKGHLYITTLEQANDPNFLVYDVVLHATLDYSARNAKTTIVFLNRLTASTDVSAPEYAAIIDHYSQKSTATLTIRSGVPQKQETADTIAFSNPVTTKDFTKFFPKIEPLQITFPAFYLVVNGGISFQAWNLYLDEAEHIQATGESCGFLMGQGRMKEKKIIFDPTPNQQRWTGVKAQSTLVSANMKFIFVDTDGAPMEFDFGPALQQTVDYWATFQSDYARLTLEDPNGQYFFTIQYYTFAKNQDVGGRTTTLATTTKSSYIHQNAFCLFFYQF